MQQFSKSATDAIAMAMKELSQFRSFRLLHEAVRRRGKS
jgi:hypothetical protein